MTEIDNEAAERVKAAIVEVENRAHEYEDWRTVQARAAIAAMPEWRTPRNTADWFAQMEGALPEGYTIAKKDQWRTIESAPVGKTGDDQILAGFMGQFRWISFVAFPNGRNTLAPSYAKPTHWMPMPPAPPKPEGA